MYEMSYRRLMARCWPLHETISFCKKNNCTCVALSARDVAPKRFWLDCKIKERPGSMLLVVPVWPRRLLHFIRNYMRQSPNEKGAQRMQQSDKKIREC
ncbi:hypothetical protein NDU88_002563 [Pleurodeles waltl]|uniref:Uncharacterized protein n=1 Tax=Pleurodeles waltl TaxID=8319 RepID=A0AAV7QD99_PLEWA|nr:hypothetical protein NDU88_002563 [Pleurodeles waltl]